MAYPPMASTTRRQGTAPTMANPNFVSPLYVMSRQARLLRLGRASFGDWEASAILTVPRYFRVGDSIENVGYQICDDHHERKDERHPQDGGVVEGQGRCHRVLAQARIGEYVLDEYNACEGSDREGGEEAYEREDGVSDAARGSHRSPRSPVSSAALTKLAEVEGFPGRTIS